jgi:hypothetical protein
VFWGNTLLLLIGGYLSAEKDGEEARSQTR